MTTVSEASATTLLTRLAARLFRPLLACLLLTAGITGLQAAETDPAAIDDEALAERIQGAFDRDELYTDALVQVDTNRGFVLLTGQVLSDDAKSRAVNITAFASNATRRIVNELQVVDAVDESTAGADAALAMQINEALQKDKPDLADAIKVVVHRSVVYLMGAMTRAQIAEAGEFVSRLPGIASIRTAFEYLPD